MIGGTTGLTALVRPWWPARGESRARLAQHQCRKPGGRIGGGLRLERREIRETRANVIPARRCIALAAWAQGLTMATQALPAAIAPVEAPARPPNNPTRDPV